jgi:hypothetical protein
MSLLYNPSDEALLTLPEIMQLPIPESRGRFHRPFSFGDYLSSIFQSLEKHHVTHNHSEFAVSKDGNRLFGLIEVRSDVSETWTTNIGVRASHDQSVSRGMVFGSRVLVCSNLCFHGELGEVRTKQTVHMDTRIDTLVDRSIEKLAPAIEFRADKFDRYQRMETTPSQGDNHLVNLYRHGAFSPSQLGKALNEWDEPSYEQHGLFGTSVWQLFNAATEALKPTGQNVNMELVRERSELVSNYMDRLAA